ncbi:tomoregulin-1-like isoform X2 [Narcine bancroftii]|uniref:tomoregulin-1-like isoform X2 n=1 Tax=Narcine bancroftii TaxID=1343680 RepID=UPI00383198B3
MDGARTSASSRWTRSRRPFRVPVTLPRSAAAGLLALTQRLFSTPAMVVSELLSPCQQRPFAGPSACCCLWLFGVLVLSSLPAGLPANPLSGAECQSAKGKGTNCSDFNERENDFKMCDETTCRYGGVCKEVGDDLTCSCQFHCHKHYIPVCASNGDTYQNECFMRLAACKYQKEITAVADSSCYTENGSGSGEGEYEGSGTERHQKHGKCGKCKYGAECDDDAEDVWCVCNIDCSRFNYNPVCASNGKSYDSPCLVKEASCQRQEWIEVKRLGKCQDDSGSSGKDNGFHLGTEIKDASDQREDIYTGNYQPCSEHVCMHGKCEYIYARRETSCLCDSGYVGQHCENRDFSILYVVPSGQKLHYVLIAAIIGAVQIAIIVAVVMCITRKCPKNNRGRRQKQNLGHFNADCTTSSRMV